jgi:hypothetical protein
LREFALDRPLTCLSSRHSRPCLSSAGPVATVEPLGDGVAIPNGAFFTGLRFRSAPKREALEPATPAEWAGLGSLANENRDRVDLAGLTSDRALEGLGLASREFCVVLLFRKVDRLGVVRAVIGCDRATKFRAGRTRLGLTGSSSSSSSSSEEVSCFSTGVRRLWIRGFALTGVGGKGATST